MNRQEGRKLLFLMAILTCFTFITCKTADGETRESIKYEKIIQAKLGQDYEIIKKKLIHMTENNPSYLADYKQAKRDQIFSLSPYWVYEERNLKIVACAVVNVHDRENKPAAVVIMKEKDRGDFEITQVIEKSVWDLFPEVSYVEKGKTIFLSLWYQAGTDWVDTFKYDRNTGQFVELPNEM